MRIWVVPHTHWDREWYLPFQHFRLRLVRTVDEIIEVLETNPCFPQFTLDGQASVIDDYLAFNPSGGERLAALVKSGKLHIGPWYTQPDEFLVGQESLVRNLLVGRATCAPFGPTMKVGYVPDIFGHVAQLPQIFRGFGIDNFMFWRGLGAEADDLGMLFRWRAPDGSEVFAIRLINGYGNAVELGIEGGQPPDVGRALARIERVVAEQQPRLAGLGVSDILMCNGGDHEPVQRNIPEILEACQDRMPGVEYRISSYGEYVARVSPAAERGPLHTGELLGSYSGAILRGVNSSRMYLKQDNERAERALLQAEILASLVKLQRAKAQGEQLASETYPQESLTIAWKEILRNHAHDSICGCSVDEVHRDMRGRSAQANHIAERLRREALAHLAAEKPAWSYRDRSREASSVVNVLPWSRTGVIELTVPPTLRGKPLRVESSDGVELPAQIIKGVDADRVAVPLSMPGWSGNDVVLKSGCKNGTGSRRNGNIAGDQTGAWVDDKGTAVENEFYRIEAQSDGALAVLYKPTGVWRKDVHFFLDEADRGDEYAYCPAEQDKSWTSLGQAARARVTEAGPVVATLTLKLKASLPDGLTQSRDRRRWNRRQHCPISVEVRLLAGVDRIEFRASVENRCRDHRLRVVFPGPAGDEVRVGSVYQVARRPFRPAKGGPDWPETPAPTQPMQGAVGVGDLSVFTRGLTEYEAWSAEDGSRVALTLLRCVEWLSRGDLSTRRGHAGPMLYTPEAQCQGQHVFEYAISFKPGLSDAEFWRAADDYRFGFTSGPSGARPQDLLSVEGEGFCLGALKGAENGDGVILRLYNPGRESARASVSGAFSRIERVRLDEEPVAEPIGRTMEIAPGQIVSLRLS